MPKVGWEEMADVPPFTSDDPLTEGWSRARDDPNIVARTAHLKAHSGISGLEVCAPEEVERVVRLFLRDGFVAVRDVMSAGQLRRVQAATAEVIAERLAETPNGVTYNKDGSIIRQPGRYSFGSHGNLHRPEWCMLADLPAVHTILRSIFQSSNFMCWGAGGDFCIPGTIEYQALHRDLGPNVGDFQDTTGRLEVWDLPPFAVTCNFPMVDFDYLNGPIRQIPGTQNSRDPPPSPAEEPEWMRLSTVQPLGAGGVIIRDLRAYHGGTPNLSETVRAIPNVE